MSKILNTGTEIIMLSVAAVVILRSPEVVQTSIELRDRIRPFM
jgi:hypothetical protein